MGKLFRRAVSRHARLNRDHGRIGRAVELTVQLFPRASERMVLLIVGVCDNIFKSSHLLIFTSSHLHIFSSSHLFIFTSVHLHIFSSSHLFIFTSSDSLLPSCSLALMLSCPLALSFFSISLLKAQGSANETARNATLSHEMRFDRPKLR